jgi:hypothetical protein
MLSLFCDYLFVQLNKISIYQLFFPREQIFYINPALLNTMRQVYIRALWYNNEKYALMHYDMILNIASIASTYLIPVICCIHSLRLWVHWGEGLYRLFTLFCIFIYLAQYDMSLVTQREAIMASNNSTFTEILK